MESLHIILTLSLALAYLSIGRADQIEEEFKKADTNGDGKLSFTEFKASVPNTVPYELVFLVMTASDKNGDGFVTLEEVRKVFPRTIDIDEAFKEADINDDKKLSFAEFKAAISVVASLREKHIRGAFDALDKDKNEYLSLDEVLVMFG